MMRKYFFPPAFLLAFIFIWLTACGPAADDPATPENTAVETEEIEMAESETAGSETGTPIIAAASEPLTAPTPLPVPAGNPLTDELATRFMYDLISSDFDNSEEILATVVESGDTRFVAVLIELIRARQLTIIRGSSSRYVAALETLSGQEFGDNWPAWIEWYGQTELAPPPGFTGWKGTLLSRIDPGFKDFLADDHPSRLRVEEIQWGGVRIDGIPPLDNATMIPAAEADYLLPNEPVFGLEINGDVRAYPLRIVDNHEMANDVVGGLPVSLAYCTLCGAAIAFDGRAPNGETYTFGTSGFLYRSNKLMYDRTTRTLWNQLTGEPVLGELAGNEELRLNIFPVVLSAWEDWLAQHPDTLVMSRETGFYPAGFYEPGVLYGDYFQSSQTMFPVWQRSDLLEDKDFVYALFLDGVPKAYDVRTLAEQQVVNDTLGETAVVLVATQGTVAVNGSNRRVGSVTYTNGGEVRAYDRGSRLFTPGPEPYTILDEEGRPWQVTEEGLLGPDGQTAPRLSGHLAYWFGWYAFFPETLLYK
jgi:hypothetical protein